MKNKWLSLVFFVALFNVTFAQEETKQRKNDIIIDPILLIASPAINASYERLLSEDSGVGINLFFGLGKNNSGFSQFSPYYRMYFGKKYASGFFVEGFLPITTTNDSYYTYDNTNGYYTEVYHDNKNTTFGIGIGFGGKWVARKNIVFEASGGIGRRFGIDNSGSDYSSGDAITGKIMLGIGYRF